MYTFKDKILPEILPAIIPFTKLTKPLAVELASVIWYWVDEKSNFLFCPVGRKALLHYKTYIYAAIKWKVLWVDMFDGPILDYDFFNYTWRIIIANYNAIKNKFNSRYDSFRLNWPWYFLWIVSEYVSHETVTNTIVQYNIDSIWCSTPWLDAVNLNINSSWSICTFYNQYNWILELGIVMNWEVYGFLGEADTFNSTYWLCNIKHTSPYSNNSNPANTFLFIDYPNTYTSWIDTEITINQKVYMDLSNWNRIIELVKWTWYNIDKDVWCKLELSKNNKFLNITSTPVMDYVKKDLWTKVCNWFSKDWLQSVSKECSPILTN